MLIPTTIPIVPQTQDSRQRAGDIPAESSSSRFAEYLEDISRSDDDTTRRAEPAPDVSAQEIRQTPRDNAAEEPSNRIADADTDISGRSGTDTPTHRADEAHRTDASRHADEPGRVGEHVDRPKARKRPTGEQDDLPLINPAPDRTTRKPLGADRKVSVADRLQTEGGDRDTVSRDNGKNRRASEETNRSRVETAVSQSVADSANTKASRVADVGSGENPDPRESRNVRISEESADSSDEVRRTINLQESLRVQPTVETGSVVGDAETDGAERNTGDRRDRRENHRTARGRLEALRAAGTSDTISQNGPIERIGTEQSGTPVREIVVDLAPEGTDDSAVSQTGLTTRSVSPEGIPHQGVPRFIPQAQLARRLNSDLGRSIVRQADVLLRDADRGEIRLVIRPPELGRVRINLQMDNGHIAGRILVDNGSVREVFEQNLGALQRAFAEAGLELGDLEISAGGEQRQGDGANERSSRPRRVASDRFDEHVEPLTRYEYGGRHINLVA